MKFRPVLPSRARELVRQLKAANAERTPGCWDMDQMEFPPGDPDREFIELVSEHLGELLAVIETNFWVE